MGRSRYSEKEILRILSEAEATIPPEELCRRYQISVQTFYRWRKKYGDRVESTAAKLKRLELENQRLRKLVIEKELARQAAQSALEERKRH